MHKKKILFVAHTMNIGGVEKSLLGELSHYSPEEWDVHVALLEQKGGFINRLPAYVQTYEIAYYVKNKAIFNNPPLQNVLRALNAGNILLMLKLIIAYIAFKITGSQRMLYRMMFKDIPIDDEEYDVACAYAGPIPFIDYYVINKIKAKEKQVWIHYDVSMINIDRGIINKLYSGYKLINVVSKEGKKKFDAIFSLFSDRSKVYHNIVSKEVVYKMAEELEKPYNNNCGKIKILTVGRVSKEKGQMMTLSALKYLVDSGCDVVWYYIGAGNDLENCKRQAKDMGLENRALFLGALTNPYPYMKHCDIYVQPSLHEGFCITLAEAKIFNRPIIATDFTGAREQLENYNSPWRICNQSPQEIADAIKGMI